MGQTIETKPTHITFKSIMYNIGVVTSSLQLCFILFKGLRKQSEDEAYQVFLLQLLMSRTLQLRSSLQSNMASLHCTVGAPIHNSSILNYLNTYYQVRLQHPPLSLTCQNDRIAPSFQGQKVSHRHTGSL